MDIAMARDGMGTTSRSGTNRGMVGRTARGGALLSAVAAAVVLLYPTVVRPWHLRFGATDEEARATLPGDDLVPVPVAQATRAITIQAPAEAVWPWLVQMGQGRGGLYSYDWLANLVNCDIHSADRIVPELQGLKVGDEVRLVPRPYSFAGRVTEESPRYLVARIEPNRALVLRAPSAEDGTEGFETSWAFVLDRVDAGTTRLIIRSRSFSEPAWMAPVIGVEPLHFLMEQKMLRGIKERAEAAV